MTEPWESPETTRMVWETEKAMAAAADTTQTSCPCTRSFPFSVLSSKQSSSSLPQISSAPAGTSMPCPLQSLLPNIQSILICGQPLFLKVPSLCPIQTNNFSRLYPSLLKFWSHLSLLIHNQES